MAWHDGLNPAFAWRVAVLLHVTREAGVPLMVSSGFRSISKQAELYEAWKSGRSPFPAARPGYSKHEKGLAVDLLWSRTGTIAPFEGAWEMLGVYAEEHLGLRWGGRFSTPDPVHFEAGGFGGGS